MSEKIKAPFTKEQATALNDYQMAGKMHPFTCPRTTHGATPLGHLIHAQTNLIAVAKAGWVCSWAGCDYTQDWAHAFMLDPEMGTL
jgi:hypothetical protein